ELREVDPAKIMKSAEARKKAREWSQEKEYQGKFTWTLALYGTPAMATEAKLTIEEYWEQIIRACFLDKDDPIGEWKKIAAEQQRVMSILNKLPMQKLRIVAEDTDLTITLGEKRRF